jgi:type VI secretion system protein ImpM
VSIPESHVRVGFFGKLPSRGDFVRVGLSRSFACAWDRWLQTVMPPAREALGPEWDDAWSNMRAWRFSFAAGLCGASAVSGVWLSSKDRVGRNFPLLIVAECVMANDGFLDAAERIGESTIKSAWTPESLAIELCAVPSPLPSRAPSRAAICWWRPGDVHAFYGDAWPDPVVFLRMLKA